VRRVDSDVTSGRARRERLCTLGFWLSLGRWTVGLSKMVPREATRVRGFKGSRRPGPLSWDAQGAVMVLSIVVVAAHKCKSTSRGLEGQVKVRVR
jgi:hypothetical protein